MSYQLVNGLYVKVRKFIYKLLVGIRHWNNARKVSKLGVNSVLLCKIDIRRAGGQVFVGDDSLVNGILVTELNDTSIHIGNNVFIGGNTIIDTVSDITIKDDVLISYDCLISDSDNHSIYCKERKNDLYDWRNGGNHNWSTTKTSPVFIDSGVWIGAKSIILKGVKIGEGAVVGAGSVVTKSIPPYTIVAGNPAKVIREIPEHER